jgi:hypothetical protein
VIHSGCVTLSNGSAKALGRRQLCLVLFEATIVQGVLRIRASDCGVDAVNTIIKLWVHEHARVYYSRCSRLEDACTVKELLHRISQRKLGSQEKLDNVFGSENEPLVFSEFVTLASSGVKTVSSHRKGPKPYELVTSKQLLQLLLTARESSSTLRMAVLFMLSV